MFDDAAQGHNYFEEIEAIVSPNFFPQFCLSVKAAK